MPFSMEQAGLIATLFREGRAALEGEVSQDQAAAGATNYLARAAARGRPWAIGHGDLDIDRHFITRVERGLDPMGSPTARIRARALAEFYGLSWARQVLPAAGILDPSDLEDQTKSTAAAAG